MSVTQISQQEAVLDDILTRIADAEGCSKLDLPPLYDAVDPDALEKLVGHDSELTVTFSYNGYEVEVGGLGEIRVTAADDTSAARQTV